MATTPNIIDDFYDTTDDHLFANINSTEMDVDEDKIIQVLPKSNRKCKFIFR